MGGKSGPSGPTKAEKRQMRIDANREANRQRAMRKKKNKEAQRTGSKTTKTNAEEGSSIYNKSLGKS